MQDVTNNAEKGSINVVAITKQRLVVIECQDYIDGKLRVMRFQCSPQKARELAKVTRVRASEADGIY
jgi:hypothetical protein